AIAVISARVTVQCMFEQTTAVRQPRQMIEDGHRCGAARDAHAATRALIRWAASSRYRCATAGHNSSGAVATAALVIPVVSSRCVNRVRNASAIATGSL